MKIFLFQENFVIYCLGMGKNVFFLIAKDVYFPIELPLWFLPEGIRAFGEAFAG